MNILDPIFYRKLFYDFRQWSPWAQILDETHNIMMKSNIGVTYTCCLAPNIDQGIPFVLLTIAEGMSYGCGVAQLPLPTTLWDHVCGLLGVRVVADVYLYARVEWPQQHESKLIT